jgi:thiol-disulfide isomerase/thioredoxin
MVRHTWWFDLSIVRHSGHFTNCQLWPCICHLRRNIYTVLLVLFTVVYLFSARVKSWVIMGFLALGFYSPHIPVIKSGEKLQPAPALVVQTVQGKVLDLQQQKGKVVFINFWATWCPPCLAELPSVNDLYLKVKDNPNIVFLSIDADNKLAKSSLFLKNRGYLFPVYSGDLTLPPTFYSGNIPTTLVINKKGYVVFNHIDKANYADEEFVQYLTGLSKE